MSNKPTLTEEEKKEFLAECDKYEIGQKAAHMLLGHTIQLIASKLEEKVREIRELKDSLQGLGMSKDAGEILKCFFDSMLQTPPKKEI